MKRTLVVLVLGLFLLGAVGADVVNTTTIIWHGHAAFEIVTAGIFNEFWKK